jgi:hypothetical protein
MAISSQDVYLLSHTAAPTSLETHKLVDIKTFPDLGGAPNMLETTTLTDGTQTFINGVKQQSVLEFTANYVEADYDAVLTACGTDDYFAVWFGSDGADGKFDFTGEMSVYVMGANVDGVIEMKITIAPTSSIVKS